MVQHCFVHWIIKSNIYRRLSNMIIQLSAVHAVAVVSTGWTMLLNITSPSHNRASSVKPNTWTPDLYSISVQCTDQIRCSRFVVVVVVHWLAHLFLWFVRNHRDLRLPTLHCAELASNDFHWLFPREFSRPHKKTAINRDRSLAKQANGHLHWSLCSGKGQTLLAQPKNDPKKYCFSWNPPPPPE